MEIVKVFHGKRAPGEFLKIANDAVDYFPFDPHIRMMRLAVIEQVIKHEKEHK